MQDGSTADMIFSVAEIISYVSEFTHLEPGDVLATGTPSGVGAGRTPPVWLAPGDHIEIEIESIGILSNTVKAESEVLKVNLWFLWLKVLGVPLLVNAVTASVRTIHHGRSRCGYRNLRAPSPRRHSLIMS